MTQEQLACELGVSRQSVAKWESDKSYPEIEKLIKMSQLFECTLDDLVQGDVSASSDRESEAGVYEVAGCENAAEPEIREPDSAGFEAAEPDSARPDPAECETAESDSAQSEKTANPDATEPEKSAEPKASNHAESPNASCEAKAKSPTPLKDEFGYDNQINKFAQGISSGVMFILFGVAVSIIFFSLSDPESGIAILPENIASAIGVLFQLAAIALGLAAILPACFEWANFVRQHPYIEDFYTSDQKAAMRTNFARELIGGIIFVFIGVVIIIFFADGPLEGIVGVPLMLGCIGIGAKTIVHGSILQGLSNINNYNESAAEVAREEAARSKTFSTEAKGSQVEGSQSTEPRAATPEQPRSEAAAYEPPRPEDRVSQSNPDQAHTRTSNDTDFPDDERRNKEYFEGFGRESAADRRIGGICGAIMLIATIAGLFMLFVPAYQNSLFWLSWPIGGLLCGVVANLGKAFRR